MNFCVRRMRPCSSDADCPVMDGWSCVDLLSDGERRCFPAGECASNRVCETRELTCGVSPGTGEATCNTTGVCRTSADCAKGASCEDVHDIETECLPPGSCIRDSECPPGSLCFDGPIGGLDMEEGDGRVECVIRRPAL